MESKLTVVDGVVHLVVDEDSSVYQQARTLIDLNPRNGLLRMRELGDRKYEIVFELMEGFEPQNQLDMILGPMLGLAQIFGLRSKE